MIKIVQGPNFISTLEMFKNFLPVFDHGLFASCSSSVGKNSLLSSDQLGFNSSSFVISDIVQTDDVRCDYLMISFKLSTDLGLD